MRILEIINPTLTWRSLLALCVLGVVAVGMFLWFLDPSGQRELAAKLRPGQTEAQVISLLGEEPAFVYDRETAPVDYYVDGWSRKERAITHRVLIFMPGALICYVWLDERGLVEDSFVCGS